MPSGLWPLGHSRRPCCAVGVLYVVRAILEANYLKLLQAWELKSSRALRLELAVCNTLASRRGRAGCCAILSLTCHVRPRFSPIANPPRFQGTPCVTTIIMMTC